MHWIYFIAQVLICTYLLYIIALILSIVIGTLIQFLVDRYDWADYVFSLERRKK